MKTKKIWLPQYYPCWYPTLKNVKIRSRIVDTEKTNYKNITKVISLEVCLGTLHFTEINFIQN